MINIKMQSSEVQKLSPKITVIGVGGAGGNAVNNMISSGLEGCEFLVCNTDAQALEHSLAMHKVQLGVAVTGGLGAGSKPEVGKAAAEESLSEIMEYLDGANMVFITAGMGGGTGTGAAPVIARACREQGILTVGVVTKPFHFEGAHRMKSAEAGIEEMQDYVDTLIVIPNQNLFRVANEKTTFADAFRMADSVLQSGVRGVTDLMVRPGLVNLDFADIRTAMLEMGKAMMGTGEAQGDKRAIEAAEAAINNPLLDDVSMKGAHGVIINVTGGYDMTLFEADEACNRIRDEVDPDANIIFGATFDESIEGTMRVSIVATGIEKEAMRNRPNKTGTGGMQDGVKGVDRSQPKAVSSSSSVSDQSAASSSYSVSASRSSSSSQVMGTQTVDDRLKGDVSQSVETTDASDMFEQQRYSAADETAQNMPHNTALRGQRYKDSFIPPKPVMVSSAAASASHGSEDSYTVSTQTGSQVPGVSLAGSAPSYPSAPSRMTQQGHEASPQQTSGLQLNPPKLPTPTEDKKTPSLFERITGTVQQRLGEMVEEKPQPAKRRVAPPPSFHSTNVSDSPAQGSLNIDTASKTSGDDDSGNLDIPAFLRRQAN